MNTKLVFFLIAAGALTPAWAVDVSSAPAISSPTAAVDVDGSTVFASSSPVYTGETQGAPMPQALTDVVGAGVFVTLTRTATSISRLPTSVQVITPEMFRRFDAQNAGEAIRHATGIQILPIGTQGSLLTARIRGSTSNQTLLLIDGRPVGGFALGSQDLSEIPIEQIDHIEIVRGGVSALYGPNAMGGVINVITKRSTHPGLPISHVEYEIGKYLRQDLRLDFGSRYGPVDYFFFGNEGQEGGFRRNSDDRLHNIGGNLGFSMGKGGKLLVDVSSYHSNAGVPGTFFTDIPTNQYNNEIERTAITPNARQVTDTNYLRSSYFLPLPGDSLFTLRAFGSQRQIAYTDPDNFVNADRHEQSHGTDAQVSLPFGFLIGGNFVHDREDSTDHITPENTFIRALENWGIFAQETFSWRALTLIPSGRYDHNSQFGDTKNPRVQLLADATRWLRFSGSAARSFRAPTIDDLYYPFTDFGGGFSYQGNPSLRPETAWTYDAGSEVHVDSFSVKTTYYRSNLTDLIQTTTDPASTTMNIGRARRQGAEIEIDHVVNAYFRDGWNYTYLENVGIPVGFSHYVTLPYSPRHSVNYQATITPAKGWALHSTLRYDDPRYSGFDQTGTKLSSMILLDLRLSYQWRQMEIYVGASDVTNRRYEEQAGFPLPGRVTYGGLRLRLWG